MKKIKYSDAELVNDPSLRWCQYRYGELIWSDVHDGPARFDRYEGDGVRLLTDVAMAPMNSIVGRLQVRRPSAGDAPAKLSEVDKGGMIAGQAMLSYRRRSKE